MKKVNVSNNTEQINTPDISSMMNGGGIEGMLGNMMMNGMMNNNNIIPEESDNKGFEEIKSEEIIEEEKSYNPDIEIITATPYTSIIKEINNKKLLAFIYLCRDTNNNLLLLTRNFSLDNKEEEMIIKDLPMFEELSEEFISKKISTLSMINYMDSYIVNMNFTVEKDFATNKDPKVTITGNKAKTKEPVTIGMSSEVFSCINFIDDYIFEGINNMYDLSLACAIGSKVPENPTEFFLVDKIESISAMASAIKNPKKTLFKKETSTNIAIVIKVSKFISNEEKEEAFILSPFDIGVEYSVNDPKFRNKTIKQIEDTYFGDADQFVSTFIISNTRLYGVDKEYMIIRGKTKDNKVRLFLFDSAMQEELIHLIKEY